MTCHFGGQRVEGAERRRSRWDSRVAWTDEFAVWRLEEGKAAGGGERAEDGAERGPAREKAGSAELEPGFGLNRQIERRLGR